jgi:hypothetical protein
LQASIKNVEHRKYEKENKMKENKTRKTHTFDKKVYAEFQKYASSIGRSVSSLIEQFMRETLKEMKKEK